MRDFGDLREQLLRAGIAPRHVRRYLGELRHHHDDLLAEEYAHGVTGAAANAAAVARLGSNDDLAAALLAKPGMRSVTARYPWLVFGILPPFATIFVSLLWVMAMLLVGFKSGALIPDHHKNLPMPAWYDWTASGMMFAVNFVIVPALAFVLAWMAARQRMRLVWPLLGMALILMLGVHGTFHADANGKAFLGLGTIIPWKGPLGPGGIDWRVFLAQGALLCLPLAWLMRARTKVAAAQ
jgi:hypothetical protein